MSDDNMPTEGDLSTLPVPAELVGMTQEELRFWRLIEEVEAETDRSGMTTWNVTLACGHSSVWVTEPVVRYAPCAQCVNGWVEEQMRANK